MKNAEKDASSAHRGVIENNMNNMRQHYFEAWANLLAEIRRALAALAIAVPALGAVLPAQASTFTVGGSGNNFTITRHGDTSAAETVHYRTVPLSAFPGQHYMEKSGTFVFAPGQTGTNITVSAASMSNAAYMYQTDASRAYSFEILDEGGFLVTNATRSVTSDLVQFKADKVSKSVTDLVKFSGGNFSSGMSSGKYLDVAFTPHSSYVETSGTLAGYVLIDDSYDYAQKPAMVSTDTLIASTGARADYLYALDYKIYATVCFTEKERDDGYQYLQIVAGNTASYDTGADPNGKVNDPTNSVYKVCFELADGSNAEGKAFFPHRGTDTTEFSLSTGKLWQQKYKDGYAAGSSGSVVLPVTTPYITTRFDAGGDNDDTWGYKDFFVRMALVDDTYPTLFNNSSAAIRVDPGPHCKGNAFYISVPFNEIVYSSGTKTISTTWGDAVYHSGDGSNVITFKGTITADAGTMLKITGGTCNFRDLSYNYFQGSLNKTFNGKTVSASHAYPITYDLGGGTLPANAPTSYTYDAAVSLVQPTRTGYTFDGWTGSNGSTKQKSVTINSGSHGPRSYVAHWTPITYTITYDLAGGALSEGESNPETYAVTNAAFTLATPVRTGYAFAGWTGTDLDGPTNEVTVAAGSTGNRSYAATWTANTYSVRFNDNDGSSESRYQEFSYDQQQSLDPAIARTGYDFSGWCTNEDVTVIFANCAVVSNLTTEADGVVDLYARWVGHSYIVRFDGNAADAVGNTDEMGMTYDVPDNLTSNGFTRTGYDFAGWSTNANGPVVYADGASVSNLTAEANGAVDLYAQWVGHSYIVRFDGNAADAVGSTDEMGMTYDVPDNLTSNGFTRTGYDFAGWSTNANGAVVYADGASVSNLTAENHGSVTLYAQWTAHTYTVRFDANGGDGEMSDQLFTYDVATNLEANAFSRIGYDFAGWSTSANGPVVYADGASVSNLTAEANGVVTLHAQWTAHTYTVHFDKNAENATGEMADMSFTYDQSQPLPSNRFSRDCYEFVGWTRNADGSGDIYNDGTDVLNLTAEANGTVTLYAKWTVDYAYFWGYGRDGSEELPYIITSTAGLDLLASEVNGGNTLGDKFFVLDCDIAYSYSTAWDDANSTENNYTPIGNDGCRFKGNFDGMGHTVSGIRIYKGDDSESDSCLGLFGHAGGLVKNVVLADTRITGFDCVGGIVGTTKGLLIENCHVTDTVALHAVQDGAMFVGGIIGVNVYGNVVGCTSSARLTIADGLSGCRYFGGITGYNNGNVSNCLAIAVSVGLGVAEGGGAICGASDFDDGALNGYYGCTVGGETANVGCGLLVTEGDVDELEYVVVRDAAFTKPVSTFVADRCFTLAMASDAIANYVYNGVAVYDACLGYRGKFYVPVGTNAVLSLGLEGGYSISGITASSGVVDGGTLTVGAMPSEDVVVSAVDLAVIPWSGSGAAEDPYIILYPSQLDLLATKVNGGSTYSGKFFKLGADIAYPHTTDWNDATSTENNYTAIGNGYCAFRGTFDGDGHTVSGIRIYKDGSATADSYQGLFGEAYRGAVKNVTLSDARITGYGRVAGIAGYTSDISTKIDNCFILNTAITARSLHGGVLVGYKSDGTYRNNFYNNCIVQVGSATYTSGIGLGAPRNDYAGEVVCVYALTLVDGVTATGESVTVGTNTYYTRNATVTLSVTPPVGCTLNTLTVTDTSNNPVRVDLNNQFAMPASDVKVVASFAMTWASLQTALNEGGTVTLPTDVTAADGDSTLAVTNTVTLDLAGHTIDADGLLGVIEVREGGNLTLTNSVPESGAITGGQADYGGGVYVDDGGMFTLAGGEISGNTANYDGGGVYVSARGMFTVSGSPVVSGNANLEVGVNNVYFEESHAIVAGGLEPGARIGVTTETTPTLVEPVTFAESAAEGDEAYFFSDNPRCHVERSGDVLQLVEGMTPIPYIDEVGASKVCIDYVVITNATGDVTYGADGDDSRIACYVVTNNVTIEGALRFSDPTTFLILCDGATLTVTNTSGNAVVARHLYVFSQANGTGAIIADAEHYGIDGRINIHGGNVTAAGGYGIYDGSVNGGIIIKGGTVTATAKGDGRGISAGGGGIEIHGGSVTATAQGYGCGIYVWNGDFKISGGSVTASGAIAGIYDMSGDVLIHGGNVTATSGLLGHGIYAEGYTSEIVLGWTDIADRITASSYIVYRLTGVQSPVLAENGIRVKLGQLLADGSSVYEGVLDSTQVSAIAGKTLRPWRNYNDPEGVAIEYPSVVDWLMANDFTQNDIDALGSNAAATEKLYECYLLNCSITAANPGGALSITGIAVGNDQISVTVQLERHSPLGAINGELHLCGASDLASDFGPIAKTCLDFGDDDSTFGTEQVLGPLTQSVTATFGTYDVRETFFKAAIEFRIP
jgi:uncharacterized repeat protein (TIGR02543 family)